MSYAPFNTSHSGSGLIFNLHEAITDILAVFELKYKAQYSKAVEDAIYADRDKIKCYVRRYAKKYPNCEYYYVVLYEDEVGSFFWLKKSDLNWTRGKVVELAAGRVNGVYKFDVNRQFL